MTDSTDRPKLTALPSLRPEGGGFACTWCGQTFARRFVASDGVLSLEEHWDTNPRCKRQRNVSNQTQSKYGMADAVIDVPGELTLFRIRSASCEHPEDMREPLFAADGQGGHTEEQVGFRCSYCYAEVPI